MSAMELDFAADEKLGGSKGTLESTSAAHYETPASVSADVRTSLQPPRPADSSASFASRTQAVRDVAEAALGGARSDVIPVRHGARGRPCMAPWCSRAGRRRRRSGSRNSSCRSSRCGSSSMMGATRDWRQARRRHSGLAQGAPRARCRARVRWRSPLSCTPRPAAGSRPWKRRWSAAPWLRRWRARSSGSWAARRRAARRALWRYKASCDPGLCWRRSHT